ncbi:MAG: flavodoxin family protein [Vulcanimicrobiota bacterium]
MKAALFIPEGFNHIVSISEEITLELENQGIEIDLNLVGSSDIQKNNNPTYFRERELIVIGAPTLNWSGDIPGEISSFIKSCNYLQGKKVATFVTGSLFGSGNAQKKLMETVEGKGAFLFDFDIISDEKKAKTFARRLVKVKQTSL